MSRLSLKRHPDTPCAAIHSIAGFAKRDGNQLWLQFRAIGNTEGIVWPLGDHENRNWTQQDGLWQHSCFEFFARAINGTRYFETNFATSNHWAAYDFVDYRTGMRKIENMEMVGAVSTVWANRAELSARLVIPSNLADKDWLGGLSAILEAKDGTKSYWALAHPPGKPDFHHEACFATELPAPRTS